MRKFLFLFAFAIFCLLAGVRSAHAAITLVATSTASSGSGSVATSTFTNNTTAGDSLIVVIAYDGISSQTPTITDDAAGGSDTFTAVGDKGYEGNTVTSEVVYYAENIKGGNKKVTVNNSGGGGDDFRFIVYEVSGLMSSGSLDQHGAVTDQTGTTWLTASKTPSIADEFVVSAFSGSPTTLLTAGNGFTLDYQVIMNNASAQGAFMSQIIASTAAIQGKYSTSYSNGYGAVIATFEAAPVVLVLNGGNPVVQFIGSVVQFVNGIFQFR